MVKSFRLNIILRVLLLSATLAGCIYLWIDTNYYIIAGLISILTIYEIFWFIHYVEMTNRKLTRFFESVRYSDFSRSFSDHKTGRSFTELNEAMAGVVERFKEQHIEKQIQFRYLQTVVEHIGIGLISFDQKGEVKLLNNAAKRLFQIASMHSVNHLNVISPTLPQTVLELKTNDHKIVTVSINSKRLQLALHATEFRLRDVFYKLVSFQDINKELEDTQMEAWQNLTGVLAHEIMNSVTPIASLSDTVQMLIKQKRFGGNGNYCFEEEVIDDVSEAIETIENRSNGLIRFVDSYRDFTENPKPDISLFFVKKLLERVRNLNKGEAEKRNIKIVTQVDPESLELTGDPDLIEQALINLVKNAFRALKDQDEGIITLSGEMRTGEVCIHVHDNGRGIKPEDLDKIFIPFYSSERLVDGGGTGIGLSLCSKIMHAHGGNLSVESEIGKGSTFTLRF